MSCDAVTHGRRSVGVLARGSASTRSSVGICGRPALDGDHLCSVHRARQDRIAAALEARKASAR